MRTESMPSVMVLKKDLGSGGISKVELIADKGMLGRCRGRGNYVVRRPNRKHYRVESLKADYKRYKEEGYRFSHMY